MSGFQKLVLRLDTSSLITPADKQREVRFFNAKVNNITHEELPKSTASIGGKARRYRR